VVKVVFLGTGGTPGVPWRAQMGILIEAEGVIYLFDVGEHIERRITELGLRAIDINKIFITHPHFDHISGIASLMTLMISEGLNRRIEVYGPPTIEEALKSIFINIGPKKGLDFVTIKPIKENIIIKDETFDIKTFHVEHSVEAVGYEINVDKLRIVYTGDTVPCENIKQRARDADLIIHEASFPDWMEEQAEATYHSTISQAIEVSKNAKQIALVHITKFSQEQIVKGPLPPKILVPSDLTVIRL